MALTAQGIWRKAGPWLFSATNARGGKDSRRSGRSTGKGQMSKVVNGQPIAADRYKQIYQREKERTAQEYNYRSLMFCWHYLLQTLVFSFKLFQLFNLLQEKHGKDYVYTKRTTMNVLRFVVVFVVCWCFQVAYYIIFLVNLKWNWNIVQIHKIR